MLIRRYLYGCLCCLTVYTTAIAQVSSDPFISELTEWIDSVRSNRQIPGMAVTMTQDGKIVYSQGFGYADIEHLIPVYPSLTRFRIGSISKTLSSSGLALLYQQGSIHPDSSIYFYLPDFPPKDEDFTIAQVAGHTAGIRHYRGMEFMNNKRYPTVADGLEIFAEDPLLFEPGTKYAYSSYGWNLISAIMEEVSDTSFLNYMEHRVFNQLGMLSTGPDYHEYITPHRSAFYWLVDGHIHHAPFVDNSYKWAGGGFLSTAEDISRFAVAHLDDTFLKAETIARWTQPMLLADGTNTGYGMAWRSEQDEYSRPWIGHCGGSVGGTSMMMIFPIDRVSIVILTNLSQADLSQLPSDIVQKWLSR